MDPPTAPTSSTPYLSLPSVNVKAIWSLPLAVLFSLVGVVLAHLARAEIRRTGERGGGLAAAALIIGYPVCALWLVFWAALLLSVIVVN